VPQYRPGQYISLRIQVPELGYMQPRQYSLSGLPGAGHLRISVKREAQCADKPGGMVSNLLHEQFHEGSVLDLAPPAGDFFLHEERSTPVILISAGVGVTPMLAMLEHLLAKGGDGTAGSAGSAGSARQVHFMHACRHGGVHAFKQRLQELQGQHRHLRSMVYYEAPRPEDRHGADFDVAGRIDLARVDATLLPLDGDYYLCGPAAFMQAQKAALLAHGVQATSIHLELFGTGGFAQ
jgi:nitric oxide dioxygenase